MLIMRTFSAPSAWGSASPSEDARGAISATTQRAAISGDRRAMLLRHGPVSPSVNDTRPDATGGVAVHRKRHKHDLAVFSHQMRRVDRIALSHGDDEVVVAAEDKDSRWTVLSLLRRRYEYVRVDGR